MPNMSYCRFRNTLSDLLDCEDALQQREADLSNEERRAAIHLIQVATRIAEMFEDCNDQEIDERLRGYEEEEE